MKKRLPKITTGILLASTALLFLILACIPDRVEVRLALAGVAVVTTFAWAFRPVDWSDGWRSAFWGD